jgi:hypothetical protein
MTRKAAGVAAVNGFHPMMPTMMSAGTPNSPLARPACSGWHARSARFDADGIDETAAAHALRSSQLFGGRLQDQSALT